MPPLEKTHSQLSEILNNKKHYEIQHHFFIICQPSTPKVFLRRPNLTCKSFNHISATLGMEFCQIQCSAKSENRKKVFTGNTSPVSHSNSKKTRRKILRIADETLEPFQLWQVCAYVDITTSSLYWSHSYENIGTS